MNQYIFIAMLAFVSLAGGAQTLTTATCEQPVGYSVQYGPSAAERVQAKADNRPEPANQLSEPKKDGYTMRPIFIIEQGRKFLTVGWTESESEKKARERAAQLGVPYCCAPPTAKSATVFMFSQDQISAVEVVPYGGTIVYSLFPKLGSVFITSHTHEASGRSSGQMTTFATCKFTMGKRR